MAWIDRTAAVAFAVAVLALFGAMPVWRWGGIPQPLAVESYSMTAESFSAKVEAMTASYATGEIEDGVAVVHPPAGDVYVTARRFSFSPILQLDEGTHYRLHVATVDVVHGFHFLLGSADDVLLLPGVVSVMSLTPEKAGIYTMQCSEYCGLSHSRMKSRVRLVPRNNS